MDDIEWDGDNRCKDAAIRIFLSFFLSFYRCAYYGASKHEPGILSIMPDIQIIINIIHLLHTAEVSCPCTRKI